MTTNTTALELIDNKFNFSSTGLTIKHQPTFEEWQECGEQLHYIESSIQWWIGDWLNYGEQRWGEMYTQALNETDYAERTLHNLKYVTSKVDSSRRREDLSFSHHSEVAALPPAEQDEWLDKAKKDHLSTRQLRDAIKRNGTEQPDYSLLLNRIIRLIDELEEVYPQGLEHLQFVIEQKLKTS